MYMHEEIAMGMAKERLEDAARSAEVQRAFHAARASRRPARLRLGSALIRLGCRLQGRHVPAPAAPTGLGQA
jgi:hypothetical protein